MKRKVSIIIGTRPEAIKMIPIIRAFRRMATMDLSVCVTAQHREMLDQVLNSFVIEPDVDLNLMRKDQSLSEFTARAMLALDKYLIAIKPDLVLVQGDTTTTLCGALSAFHRHIPVAHVEAGLRTRNMEAPWPEEGNRVLVSRLASIHFAPTRHNRDHLISEGVPRRSIHVTGNTVVDALQFARRLAGTSEHRIEGLPESLQPGVPARGRARMVLVTSHRRENLGEGLNQVCGAIAELARRHPDVHFVFPVHLNPQVRQPVMRLLGAATGLRRDPSVSYNVHLIEPQPYLPFIGLMDRSFLILTDSGGIQEEGPSLGKPVIVMRSSTERPEGVAAGVARLVGTRKAAIEAAVTDLLASPRAYALMARATHPYGDGRSGARIARLCSAFLKG